MLIIWFSQQTLLTLTFKMKQTINIMLVSRPFSPWDKTSSLPIWPLHVPIFPACHQDCGFFVTLLQQICCQHLNSSRVQSIGVILEEAENRTETALMEDWSFGIVRFQIYNNLREYKQRPTAHICWLETSTEIVWANLWWYNAL